MRETKKKHFVVAIPEGTNFLEIKEDKSGNLQFNAIGTDNNSKRKLHFYDYPTRSDNK